MIFSRFLFSHIRIFSILFLSFLFSIQLYSQCVCTDCGISIADQANERQSLYVNYLANEDLGVNQTLSEIKLVIQHDYIADLKVTLISPSNDEITLIGKPDNLNDEFRTRGTIFDVSFIPSTSVAQPAENFDATWTNSNLFGSNKTIEGSYYPYDGDLSALTGVANGLWQLEFEDFNPQDSGRLVMFELVFSNNEPVAGFDKAICATNACNMFFVDDFNGMPICSDAELNIKFTNQNNIGSIQWTGTNGGSVESGATTNNVTLEGGGDYEVAISDPTNTCEEKVVYNITEVNTPASATTDTENRLTCSQTNLNLDVPSDLPNDSYSFEWKDEKDQPQGTQRTLNVNTAQVYSLETTHLASGCVAVADYTVSMDTVTPKNILLEEVVTEKNCTEPHKLTLFALKEDLSAFTPVWYLPDGSRISADTLISNLDGTFEFALLADNGCEGAKFSYVSEIDTQKLDFKVSVENNEELGCEISKVQIRADINTDERKGFKWTGPSNFESTNLFDSVGLPGIYTAEVIGNNNCVSMKSIEVKNDPSIPSVQVDLGTKTACNTELLKATITGNTNGYAREWTNSLGDVVSSDTEFEADKSGLYTFTLTDGSCTLVDTRNVLINDTKPVARPESSSKLDCSNQNTGIILSGRTSTGVLGTAGLNYKWLDQNGVNLANLQDITITEAGSYNLIVIDRSNFCADTTQIDIQSSTDLPTFTFMDIQLPLDTVDCYQPVLLPYLDGITVANITIGWFRNDVEIGSSSQQAIDQEGKYKAVVTNNLNGCSYEESFEVTDTREFPILVISERTLPVVSCRNPVAEIPIERSIHQPNHSYLWTGPVDGIVSGEDSSVVMVKTPGTYTITLTNTDNGCNDMENIEVKGDLDIPDVYAAKTGNLDCKDTIVRITGSEQKVGFNFRYSWTGPNNFESFSFNNAVNEPGEYNLRVLDVGSGCDTTTTIEVERIENTFTSLNAISKSPTCWEGENGTITLNTPLGGTAPFTYLLEDIDTINTSLIDSLTPGTYKVKVIDKGFCELEENVTVFNPTFFELDITGKKEINLGEELVLSHTSNYILDTLYWEGVSYQDTCVSVCGDISFFPTRSQSLKLTAISDLGCEQFAFHTIEVDDSSLDVNYANALSLNGKRDVNFQWEAHFGASVKRVEDLSIFNRWGNLMIQKNSFPDESTNKTELMISKDELINLGLQPGVYLFQMSVEYIDGRKSTVTGDFMVF